jgi:hypothetical protein
MSRGQITTAESRSLDEQPHFFCVSLCSLRPPGLSVFQRFPLLWYLDTRTSPHPPPSPHAQKPHRNCCVGRGWTLPRPRFGAARCVHPPSRCCRRTSAGQPSGDIPFGAIRGGFEFVGTLPSTEMLPRIQTAREWAERIKSRRKKRIGARVAISQPPNRDHWVNSHISFASLCVPQRNGGKEMRELQ